MTQKFGVIVAMTGLAVMPLMAQSAAKTTTAKAQVGAADKAFAREAAIGGMTEVELGNLAKEKAASDDVKQFGERMVTDHSKANDELKAWASQKGVTLPSELDAKHKAVRDRLSKLSGAAFDKAYMADMLTDHKEDVATFKKESSAARDADLKAWASQTLPTLEEHLKQARDTAAKVGVTTTAMKSKGR